MYAEQFNCWMTITKLWVILHSVLHRYNNHNLKQSITVARQAGKQLHFPCSSSSCPEWTGMWHHQASEVNSGVVLRNNNSDCKHEVDIFCSRRFCQWFKTGKRGVLPVNLFQWLSVSGSITVTCGSRWRAQGIVPNGEGEPMWLTPHQRDSQREGESRITVSCNIFYCLLVVGDVINW